MSGTTDKTTTTSDAGRSSQDGTRRTSGMFSNLEEYKRGTDTQHSVRRESLSEQTTQGKSMIGEAFNSVFKGGADSK